MNGYCWHQRMHRRFHNQACRSRGCEYDHVRRRLGHGGLRRRLPWWGQNRRDFHPLESWLLRVLC